MNLPINSTTDNDANGLTAAPTANGEPPDIVTQYQDLDIANPYESLMRRGQLVVIAACTGRHKSNFCANAAVYAASLGRKVVWLNLDMDPAAVRMKFLMIAHGVPEDTVRKAVLTSHPVLKQIRLSDMHWGPDQLREQLIAVVQAMMPADVIVIDGFDRLYSSLDRAQIDTLVATLAHIAETNPCAILISSQVTKDGAKREVLEEQHLAFSNAKSHPTGLVLALGGRILDRVLTLCALKDRHNVLNHRTVYRLYFHQNLRLVPEPIGAEMIVVAPSRHGIRASAPTHHNALPDDFAAPPVSEAGVPPEEADNAGSRRRAYHGTKGFIPVGRAVFGSAIFENRDLEALGLLLVLYEHAAIAPAQPYAPATATKVNLTRGQVLTSVRMLAHELAISEKRVRTLLDRLEKEGLIRQQNVLRDGTLAPANANKGTGAGTSKGKAGRVVTLCHYSANKAATAKPGTPSGAETDD